MITPIVRHELRQVLFNSKTWGCLSVLQILQAIIFNWLLKNFLKSQAISNTMHFGITEEVLHPYYAWFALLVLMLAPMLATQMICAEKQRGTIVNYYCAPISSLQFMLGKFLSLNILLFALIAFISIMPCCIVISGELDWGQFAASILGVYLMLSAAFSIGLCVSAYFSNIMRTNMFIFIILLSFILIEWAAQYMGPHAMYLQNFGLLKPLKVFLAGIISVQALSYYALLVVGSLWLGSAGYRRVTHG